MSVFAKSDLPLEVPGCRLFRGGGLPLGRDAVTCESRVRPNVSPSSK